MGAPYVSVAELAERIQDGSLIALPPDYSLVAMAAVRALVRKGVRNLHVLGVPVAGFPADVLIGAGSVAAIETSAVSLGEAGFAPAFTRAATAGTVRVIDATCPAIHTALQAAEKGVPFLPLRGLLGSDVLRHRDDWRVIGNPFAANDPIVLIPAIRPDVALFHARFGDREGNVWVGRRRELATIAHAAHTALVTVEEVRGESLIEDETLAPGTISSVYVGALAHAPRGAWPLGLLDLYPPDEAHLAEYARMARTAEGFASYLARHVLGEPVPA
ncbi:MAG: CoA synthetase [Proteobacteria bacterium]|nr:CoA synthetase [Pseudomonadota bacterium]